MRRTRMLGLATLITTGALLLTACSAGSPSGQPEPTAGSAGDGGLTPITVGLISIAPSAPVQYGIDHGIFEKHGLDVEVQIAQGGAAMLPAVSTGQMDFGVGNPLSVEVASTQGVDVRIVTGFSNSLEEGDDINAVITRADSGLSSWTDLEGKSVSVNAVNTTGDLTIMGAVEGAGGDPQSVEFIEIAFPDALAQLDAGNVDAVWVPEPFITTALASPDKYSILGYPMQDSIPGLATMVTFTSGAVAEDAELIEKWRAAIDETLQAVSDDREGLNETIVEFTGMPAELVSEIRLERFGDVERQILVDLADMALKYEFMETEPDLDTVIIP